MSAVLLITRDPSTEKLAAGALATAGHEVVSVASADAAIRGMFSVTVSLIILDSSIGEEEARQVGDWLEEISQGYPLVLLTVASSLWLGDTIPLSGERDQMLVKPCDPQDILRAVENALRPSEPSGAELSAGGGLKLDGESHELRGDGLTVQLTPTEFRLMHYLMQRQGSIVSSEELLEKVWEFYPGTGSSELVRSHVRNLRGKLRQATGGAELVQTVPRRGYRLR